MLRVLWGLILVLGGLDQSVPAQPPSLDSLENACRCWLQSAPTTAENPRWQGASVPPNPTLVWQGKPTGLPIALWNAVQQAPTKQAIQLTLKHWYQVPWPGRKRLTSAISQRMPELPCSRYLIKLLD